MGVARVDQFNADANLLTRAAHRTVDEIARTEQLPQLAGITLVVLVDEARVPGDDGIGATNGQAVDQVFRQAVGKIRLLNVSSEISKWQYGNGVTAGEARNTVRILRR